MNPGEWIDFEELCRRVPTVSRSTLNRRVYDRSISFRQTTKRGRREFNWITVKRELAAMERTSNSIAANESEELPPHLMKRELAELRALVAAIAKHVGVPEEFPGEQRKAS